jgi:uncharacterized membrane protein (UPF0127 family)
VTEPASRPARLAPSPGSGRLVARNRTRGTLLAADIESADGLWAKFMGLMGRRSLSPRSGLWLPDSNGIHMMFMRFPIDAIFLGRPGTDGTRTVLAARADLPAWRGLVPFVRGAKGVLELPTGTIDATRTMVGDSVSLEGD